MRHHVHCKDHDGVVAMVKDSQATRASSNSNETKSSLVESYTTLDLIHMNTRKRLGSLSPTLGQSNAQLSCLSYSFPYHMNKCKSILPYSNHQFRQSNNVSDLMKD